MSAAMLVSIQQQQSTHPAVLSTMQQNVFNCIGLRFRHSLAVPTHSAADRERFHMADGSSDM
eukprot:m.147641 g.147641  ORF g.147641 m.147641 type:complete len:62 (-) comp20574_c2_seq1:415-600(-)